MAAITLETLKAEIAQSQSSLYWKHEVSRSVAKRIAGRIPRCGYEIDVAKWPTDNTARYQGEYTLVLQNISDAVYRFVVNFRSKY